MAFLNFFIAQSSKKSKKSIFIAQIEKVGKSFGKMSKSRFLGVKVLNYGLLPLKMSGCFVNFPRISRDTNREDLPMRNYLPRPGSTNWQKCPNRKSET